jgi:hypothetical protein
MLQAGIVDAGGLGEGAAGSLQVPRWCRRHMPLAMLQAGIVDAGGLEEGAAGSLQVPRWCRRHMPLAMLWTGIVDAGAWGKVQLADLRHLDGVTDPCL